MRKLWKSLELDNSQKMCYYSNMYNVTLHCPHCDKDFETKWVFGDDVQCTHCHHIWETDAVVPEATANGYSNVTQKILGPWIVRPAGEYKI